MSNPKEKENNQEEELKTQATPNECDEETVGQETSQENEAPQDRVRIHMRVLTHV